MTDSPEISTSSTQKPHDRQIRVFISSTFKDMHAERELLIKHVFPELRRICAERFVTFTEVDLRWGITEEQAAEGKVLPICLEEIHRCRPYFIGLLGERYGWIPESVPKEVIDKEPWLQEHVGDKTSVTELEILHGVLRNPEMAGHAFFYFRDPAYVNSIPEKDRGNFLAENEEGADKLKQLKERIIKSGLPVLENYADPNALADVIREQFKELIDKLYPKEEVPDPLDQEANGHESFGRGKLLAYVERPVHTAAIDAFVSSPSTGQGLAITGESGTGKTALLADWNVRWKKNHPDDFVLVHFFGSTPDSASVNGFLRRLFGELKRGFEIADEIPHEPDKLREALPLWLAQTVGKGRIILLLDALNQIEGDAPDRSLVWLPRFFPEHIRVIASSLAGSALCALQERGWKKHEVLLAALEERVRMIQSFFNHYRKTLPPGLIQQIAEAPGSANPLFLRTMLEELRQFGSFEKLPDRITHYLEAKSPEILFRKVLTRWREDFDAEQDLVCNSLRFLWAARQGLSEPEWLELLGTTNEPLSRQVWSPLFLTMEPHLSQRSGLWAFGHNFLRQAVEGELLPSEKERRAAHLTLADYFENQAGMSPRKATEWPWQLHVAESWERLESSLTDKDLFLAHYIGETKWELSGYWHPLRAKGISLGNRYSTAFEKWILKYPSIKNDFSIPQKLGSFLADNGCYPEAEPLIRRAMEGFIRILGEDHSESLYSINVMGDFLKSTGDYAAAEPLLRKSAEGLERVLGKDAPSTLTSLSNLAVLLLSKGDSKSAVPLFRQVLEGRERVYGKEHIFTLHCIGNLAVSLAENGDYIGAESLYRRAIEGNERMLGKNHPETLGNVNNLGALFEKKKDYSAAEHLYRRALEGDERVLGKDHPNTLMSLNNLGVCLHNQKDYASAGLVYRRVLESRERILGKDHPKTISNMNYLAGLKDFKGDLAEAESLYRRVLESCERVLGEDHSDTLTSLQNLSGFLEKTNRNEEAKLIRLRSIEIISSKSKKNPMMLRGLALDCFKLGDYEKAEELLNRLLQTGFEPTGTRHHLARVCMMNDRFKEAQNHVAQALADLDSARPYIIARLLWFRIAFMLIDGKPEEKDKAEEIKRLLGKLKTVFQNDDAFMKWTMQPVLDHLKPRLTDNDHALLTALVDAMSDRANVEKMDVFRQWRDAKP